MGKVKDVLLEYADQRGWDDHTLLDLLLTFLQNQVDEQNAPGDEIFSLELRWKEYLDSVVAMEKANDEADIGDRLVDEVQEGLRDEHLNVIDPMQYEKGKLKVDG